MTLNRNNLIPTTVMRSDGHMTTVHKKEQRSPSNKSLGLPPTLTTAPTKTTPTLGKPIKVTWDLDPMSSNRIPLREGDVLVAMGLVWKNQNYPYDYSSQVDDYFGTVVMSPETIYDYLKLGISRQEAALLEHRGSLSEWSKDPKFIAATPGMLSYITYGDRSKLNQISKAVDYLREEGIPPKKAEKMIANGFSDKHLGGVLTASQLENLFSRFKTTPSVTENADTTSDVLTDALVSGRLSFAAFECKARKVLLSESIEALWPTGPRSVWSGIPFSDEDREALKADPDLVVQIIKEAETEKIRFQSMYKLKQLGAKPKVFEMLRTRRITDLQAQAIAEGEVQQSLVDGWL